MTGHVMSCDLPFASVAPVCQLASLCSPCSSAASVASPYLKGRETLTEEDNRRGEQFVKEYKNSSPLSLGNPCHKH